ncbi:MAG: helix-turn-helix transcriptional regulator [Oscillospiraceae bacterium]|jgi:transcriptional regulator with XRE-family HTH domain|nr:helix-turn-helix transcriptional regulator [Oscillospiraceae bacterium]
MKATAARLVELRRSIGFSQIKMAATLGISQGALNRYEHDDAKISDDLLTTFADYFDVSIDYICGRTDKPEGKLFSARPNVGEDNEELRQFIEFCFDAKSPMSRRLKETLYQMMTGGEGK